jgi:hypothetical protein
MCGKNTVVRDDYDTKNENRQTVEDSPSDIIVEQIDGTCYVFDTINCANTFKKFMDVYGSSFADE